VARAWVGDSQSEREVSRNQKSRPVARAAFEGEQLACQQHGIIMHDPSVSAVTPDQR